MGTTLTGTTPQDTYDSLIKVTDNGPLSGSLKKLTDGLGNDSALSLSTGAASVTGTLAVSSGITSTGANTMLSASSSTEGLVVRGGSSIGTASTASGQILIGQTGTYRGSIAYDDNAGYLYIDNLYNNNAGNIYFRTKTQATAVEALTILGSGNVGIGTSAPLQKLGIDGSIVLQSSTVATQSLIFRSPNSNWGPQNSRIDFIPADGANASVDISFNLWNGSVGNTVETLRFPYTGGIKFPATQISSADANTLDDYEEGTWTPSLIFSGGSTGITYTTQAGKYVKIGSKVSVNCYVVLSNKGSSTGSARIDGLPFTVPNAAGNYSPAIVLLDGGITYTGQAQGFANINSTSVALGNVTEAGSATALTDTNFSNSSAIMISLTYLVS